MGPESRVEQSLIGVVSRLGGVAYKFASPSRRGVPDRVVVLPGGRVMFVEVKAPGGRLSKLQEFEIARLRSLGARVVVIWSANEIAGALA